MFSCQTRKLNLLHVVYDELERNMDGDTMSANDASTVRRLFGKINEFNAYADAASAEREDTLCYDLDEKLRFLTQNNVAAGSSCCAGTGRIPCGSTATKKQNWRKLKPNSGPNIFTLNKKHTYNGCISRCAAATMQYDGGPTL